MGKRDKPWKDIDEHCRCREDHARPRTVLRPLPAVIALLFVSAVQAQTVIPSSTTEQTLSSDHDYVINIGTTISSPAANALNFEGLAPVVITNAGTVIGSTDAQATAMRLDVPGSLNNLADGSLLGNTYGVVFFGGGLANNVTNQGDISARTSQAIAYEGSSSGTVDNFGTLNDGRAGAIGQTPNGVFIQTTGNVTVNNHVGATIRSGTGDPTFGSGIVVQTGTATINNDGIITGYRGGIEVLSDNPLVVNNSNTGIIRANLIAGVTLRSNSVLNNNGLISSVQSPAVILEFGNNHVTLGTGSTLNGFAGVSIRSTGQGNTITLTGTGTENGSYAATSGNGFTTLTADTGSVWTLNGAVALGGTSASALDVLGDLTLGGPTVQGGGATTIAAGGRLALGTGGTSGVVDGNIANNGTLVFNRSDTLPFDGVITGSGTMTQSGSGVVSLSGVGSSQGAVNVNAGTLIFLQSGKFSTTGNVVTAPGATTAVFGQSQLVVGNAFTMNGTLDNVIGVNEPAVTAATATIGPNTTFNVAGYNASSAASASELASGVFTEIHTTTPGGLNGKFTNVSIGGASAVDYLTVTAAYTAQDFDIALGPTWYASHSVTPERANGVFTLTNGADFFDMDAMLIDQSANPATQWDGTTLTKAGAGTLQLSKANTYTGPTLIEAGTLRTGIANAIANSSRVSVASGATFDLNGFDQTVNDLNGAGSVTLGGASLTAAYAADDTFGGVISGAGNFAKTGASALTLTGTHTYTGTTAVDAGALLLASGAQLAGTSQVTIAPGATLGGYGTVGGAVVNNGLLAVADAAPGFAGGPAGAFVINGALTNSGEIRMSSPTPASTLTVGGNYIGNNGRLTVSTALGGDNSATDKLVVHGDTSGQTSVTVNNAGGTGGLTTNGIQIVQVDGQSNGVFTLAGRVVAGPYEYELMKGGLTSPNDGDWYLRSDSNAPSPPPSPPPVPTPIPRPEPGGYLANQEMARNMFTMTMHDRIGMSDPFAPDGMSGNETTAWVRTRGDHTDMNAANGRISESADTALIQAGIDLWHRVSANGNRWQAGLMAAYGSSTTDVSAQGNPATARGNVNGASVGAYGTWHRSAFAADGPYVDTWLQYAHYDNSVQGTFLNGESYASQWLAASVEGGWAFKVAQTSSGPVLVEPQAQFIYSNFSADNHVETNGTVVQSDTINALTTRLGVRLFHAPGSEASPGWLPYIELNWWHDTSGNAISFDTFSVSQDGPRDRMEVKIGAQGQIARQWRVWGNLAYQQGNGGYRSYQGLLGARYTW